MDFWSIFLAILLADLIAIWCVHVYVHYRRGESLTDIVKAFGIAIRLIVIQYIRVWATIVFFAVAGSLLYTIGSDIFGLR